jgi:alkylhydroperoxidase family enzyme
MPHINLGNDDFGIMSLFEYRPETARPLSELAEMLLRGPSPLTRGERELIASYVSSLNDCSFCTDSQRGGKQVSARDIEDARQAGADDLQIHDTVLIAAAFCMYNRYVDGLATTRPADRSGYAMVAEAIANHGYLAGLPVPAQAPLPS